MIQVREFRPGLWLTELVLPEYDVRGAVIVGEDRVLVWDTLSHPRDMQPIAELAGDKPIYVVYSHADWDHCWGTAALKTDVIIGVEACTRRFHNGDVQADLVKAQQSEPDGGWDQVRLIAPTLTFHKRLEIDLGGVVVELHALRGHTEDCVVAFIADWGILLAGDTVETPLPYLHTADKPVLNDWIDGLASWARNDRMQTMIPAHGEIGDKSVIERNLRYLRDLRDQKAPHVPSQLDAFYSETHANNLKLAGIG